MDHSRVPVLEALEEFRRRGDMVFGPPGHKQGRGVDPRVAEIVGLDVFRSDVLSSTGWTTAGSPRACSATHRI